MFDEQRPVSHREDADNRISYSSDLLAHPEDRLRLLEENIRDYALIVIETDRQIVGWNIGAESIFGWTEAEATALSMESLFTSEDKTNGVPAQELELAAQVGRSDDERWLARKDGSHFWATGVMTALRDRDGGLRGYAKVVGDQTEQKVAEIKLLAARVQAQTQERTFQLLAVGGALGGALTTREVADVVLMAALPILGASTGLVALLSSDGTSLYTAHVVGVAPHELLDGWHEFPMDASTPLAEAVREQRLTLVPFGEEFASSVPSLPTALGAVAGVQVTVPLMIAAKCVGGLAFICPPEYCQDEGQIAFLWTLAGQCALALERARLYDEAQREAKERQRVQEALKASEQKFRSIINASKVAYALHDDKGRITFLNTEFMQVFGYTQDDVPTLAEWWLQAYPDPQYRQWVEAAWQKQLEKVGQEETSFEAIELTIQCKDGTKRTVLAGATPLGASFTGDQLVSLYDITDRKRAEDEKARLVEYNHLLLESTAEGIYGMNMEGQCTFVNKAATRLLGYTMTETIGRDMHALIHHSRSDGSSYPVTECPIYTAFQQGIPCHVETEVLWRQDGTFFPASYSSYPITSVDGIIGAVVTFSDITERKQAERQRAEHLLEAEKRAERDPLTDLFNHRVFQKRLEVEAARAHHEGTTLAVIMLDLNNFKFFNDAYGHAVGDEVLKQVAESLRSACRQEDVLARYGGDEFAMLLPSVANVTHKEIEEQILLRTHGLAYYPTEQDTAIPITISVGVAIYPSGSLTWQEVVNRADERLRRMKANGGSDTEADQVRVSMLNAVEGFSMLDALVTAVDNKDRYTRRHSEDVLTYSLMIARELKMDKAEQHTVAVSALLHDVGKIGVPDATLRKPGKLTEAEFEAIKQHPTMGALIVGAVPGLEGALDAVQHHHERWDGDGYPFGLRGEDTPLIARLMAVADAFSAMTTDRPYRQGMDATRAQSILESGVGTQWDPECVAALLRALAHSQGAKAAA